MKELNTDQVTKNLLQFCYTCDDAALCTSEEVCRHCWAEHETLLDEEEKEEEKEEESSDICKLINKYHE
ncbi:MAG: hypothetical protein H7X86_03655 [Gorillibacterium sp.]|nr:hypothetical protein [Gorillibacterium sp.]